MNDPVKIIMEELSFHYDVPAEWVEEEALVCFHALKSKGFIKEKEVTDLSSKLKIKKALSVAEYGAIDGAHHKMWVIDQMVRELTGDDYQQWVNAFCHGEDGPMTYEWDEGIAP